MINKMTFKNENFQLQLVLRVFWEGKKFRFFEDCSIRRPLPQTVLKPFHTFSFLLEKSRNLIILNHLLKSRNLFRVKVYLKIVR